MQVKDFIDGNFEFHGTIRVFAGHWDMGGTQVGYVSNGWDGSAARQFRPGVLDSNITQITVSPSRELIIECDAKIKDIEDKESYPEITGVMTISTGHVTPETYDALELGIIEIPAYRKMEPSGNEGFGLFVYADADSMDWGKIPQDLKRVLTYALQNGCRLICLDSDGPVVDALERYRWE